MSNVHKRYPRSYANTQNHSSTSCDSEDKPVTFDENSIYTPLPKHIPFPDVPSSSEIFNEFYIFLFSLIAAGAQFMHLYRTVWWLPDSYTNHTINFLLIDPYLSVFIVVLLGRRLVFCVISKILELILPDKVYTSVYSVFRIIIFVILISILGGCTYKIFQNHSYVYTVCLCYPLVLYTIIFGFNIEPFLKTICETKFQYMNLFPLHSCSTNPTFVRTEADTLIADFNRRFKQIIFTSVVNAYYAGFIPCFFAQKYLFYDTYWTIQHLTFIWTGVFGMCVLYCFPAKYSDILHRASLHLGQWTRVDSINETYQCNSLSLWSKTVFWQNGSLIKYADKIFESTGHITSAVPNNTSHFRFYLIFKNPSILYLVLATIQLTIVIIQMIILYLYGLEWHNSISLTFLIFVNYTILFNLCRDYLVTHKIYTAESSIYNKLTKTSYD